MKVTLATLALFLVSTQTLASEVSRVATPRGAQVEILLDVPASGSNYPLFVLAPGQGYHARLPLLEKLAQSLAARGVMVARFNWAYYVSDPKTGKPSNGLVDEIEDLRAVIKAAKEKKFVDSTRIAIGGKSLETLAAWPVFRDDASILALAQ